MTAYKNLTSPAMINVSAVQLTLPTVGAAAGPPEPARRTS